MGRRTKRTYGRWPIAPCSPWPARTLVARDTYSAFSSIVNLEASLNVSCVCWSGRPGNNMALLRESIAKQSLMEAQFFALGRL